MCRVDPQRKLGFVFPLRTLTEERMKKERGRYVTDVPTLKSALKRNVDRKVLGELFEGKPVFGRQDSSFGYLCISYTKSVWIAMRCQ